MLDHSFEHYLVRCMEIPEILHFFSLKQLISCPTRISCSSPTIIDHILASQPENVSQKRSLALKFRMFCTRKALKIKAGSHKKINTCSLKNYSVVKALKKGKFSNYENFFKNK